MQLTPYITFSGNCEEALDFYAKALGGEIKNLMRFEAAPAADMPPIDKQKIMHAHFAVDGNMLFMASDGEKGGEQRNSGTVVHLSLNFTDSSKMENIFAKMSEGGKVTMPLQDTFWGARFGMFTDRFGVRWMFNCEKNNK